MDDDTHLLISNSETTSEDDTSNIPAPPPPPPEVTTSSTALTMVTTSTMQQQANDEKLQVGVIGTGTYALALARRLTSLAGCDVILGSRKPELRRATLAHALDSLCCVELASVEACISASDLVVVALHWEDFSATLHGAAHLLAGKVVVDVSNRDSRTVAQSNAEYLASMLHGASVVKAFNSVSAVAMDEIAETGHAFTVYVAGNDPGARRKVMTLATAMGFRPVNLGVLTSARWMENHVLRVFPYWRVPVAMATVVFALYAALIMFLTFAGQTRRGDIWEQFFLFFPNKAICFTAITMLALTYLPGQLASVLQVYHGTKHRRFPQVMDTWLKCRKQLGLVTFFLVTVHAIMSTLVMSPTYFHSWFHELRLTIPANTTFTSDLVLIPPRQWMTWKGEAASTLGILGFVLMGVVAVTSIRSVGESLNWSEWRFVHSQLSYGVLAVSVGHVVAMAGPGWVKRGFPAVLKNLGFLCVLLPVAVLVMKLAFSVPPLSGYLGKIRRGWEREDLCSSADVTGGNTAHRSSGPAAGQTGHSRSGGKVNNAGGPKLQQAGGSGSAAAVDVVITNDTARSDRDSEDGGGYYRGRKYGALELDQIRSGGSAQQAAASAYRPGSGRDSGQAVGGQIQA